MSIKKKKTHGFSIEILGKKCKVFFKKYDNNRITKCHLIVENDCSCGECGDEFVGIAKLSPEDVMDFNIGESISLGKAVDKYQKKVMNELDKRYMKVETFCEELNETLFRKLNKLQGL